MRAFRQWVGRAKTCSAQGFRRKVIADMRCAEAGSTRRTGKTGQANRMIRRRVTGRRFVLASAIGLAGCNLARLPPAPVVADLREQTQRGDKPTEPLGACWASDETPAVIETVTQQISEAASGQNDARYRTETRQEIVQPREKIWFRTPCASALTRDVISTLQRALAARGFYSGEANGMLDAETRTAIRAFQAPRGLNSGQLSLTAAQELGVVASDLGAKALES